MLLKRFSVLILLAVSAFTFASAATPTSTCITLTKNLSKGQENSEVLTLQQFLFDGGYLTTKPNGYFGPGTVTAVKRFQIANGMSPVGSVGPATRGKVKEVSCKKIAIQNTSSTTPSLVKQNSPEISKVDNLGVYENKEVVERLYGTNMTPYFQENHPMVGEKFQTEAVLFGQGLSSDQEIKSVDVLTATSGGAKPFATFVDEVRTNKEYIENPQKVIGKSIYTITVEWTPNLIDFEKTDTLTIVILFKDNKIQKIPLHKFPTKYVNFIKEDLKNKILKDGSITVSDPKGIYLIKINARDPKKPILGIFQLDEIVNRFGFATFRYLTESATSSNILSTESLDSPSESIAYRYARFATENKYVEKLITKDKAEKEKIASKSSQDIPKIKDNLVEKIATTTNSQNAVETRNAQRSFTVRSIFNALSQYTLDNNGVLPLSITRMPTEICSTTGASCSGFVDLGILKPKYISILPSDPQKTTTFGSGYVIFKNESGSGYGPVTVYSSLAEEGERIIINR